MSATSSISSTSAPSNNSSKSNSNNSSNVLSSAASNIVILENQILDSNDVVAAAGLQQLSNAGTIKLTRDCALQYSNLINSYAASGGSNSASSTSANNNGSPQMNTVNIIPGDASQTSSRVQVLSNVQLVSKGGSQPSTFSYVDASGKNFNVLTSSGKISTNKLISVPITKVKSFNHIGQQQQQQSTPQHTHILSSQLQQPQQQKVTVPRSIQLVTRIPNSTISVSNGRVQQLTPTISSSSQPQYSIQQYADSGTSISSSSLDIKASTPVPIVSSTNSTNAGKTTTTGKGKAASTSLKMMQNTPINHGTKSTVGKGMSVSLKSVRNNSKNTMSGINPQYYVKNSTNGTLQQSQPGTTTSIYTTSPAQAVYHNPTPHPPQQQQQQQPMQFPITTVPSTGKGKGVYKTSKNQLIQIQQQQQQQQQHQPHQSPQRSVTPQSPSPIGPPSSYSVPLSSTTSRYQNYNSYSIPSSSTANTTGSSYKTTYSSHLYQTNAATSSTYDSSTLNNDPLPPSHQIQPSMTVTGYTSTTGKGKKYGAPIANNNDNFTAVTPIKVKGRGRNNSISNYQPPTSEPPNAATPYQQRYSASPSRPPAQFQPSPIHQHQLQQNQQISTTSSSSGVGAGRDDHYIINGQQMTDETSARILQSLSQKQVVSEPQQQQQSVKYKPQQQFTFYGSDSVPQSPSSVPAGTFIPGSTNSGSSTNIPGIVYDPSDARFYDEKPDGRRSSSTSEVITYADNIPLREGYPPDYKCYSRVDDEHIGVEVRPAPVDTRNGRYFILQAVMQDHTYFAPPPEQKPPEPPPVASVASTPAPVPTPPVITPASLHQHMSTKQKSCSPAPITSIAGSIASTIPTQSSSVPTSSAVIPAPLTQMSLSSLAAYTSSVMAGAAAAAGGSISPAPATAVGQNASLDYIYHQRQSLPQDDDANSVISTGSRNFNATDNDLGEETETAPEGEGEDDSVTRCICDLTHDDGYMICCDKCSAWQHVDCMGIDRMNIPDEYNCEMCQPREVDRNRARMLQLEKRKEQSMFLANNNLQQMQQQQQQQVGDPAVTSTNLLNVPVTTTSGSGAVTGSGGKGANQYTTGKALAGTKKNKAAGTGSKKKTAAEGGAAAVPKKISKKTAENALNRLNGKRKELKKPSKKKVKTTEQNAEKMSNMIRTWIDNYERAITNHYSPELRARLQAFGKMQSQNPLLNSDRLIPAASVTNLMQKCTTVPHAGGKILISTGDIEPKTPIIEIRGKYMISSQHKQLQSLFNMAANGKLSNNKNAGPYLFLYQLTNGGMELCVDTRTYGNDARFIRRSCRPNAEILHNVDKGVVHLYIVSTSNIKANTEITIKHDEQLIQRVGGVVILTHTTVTNLCACGLIKECQYSAQLSEGLLPPAVAPTGLAPAPVPGSGMALANIVNTQPIPGIAQTPLTVPTINSSGLPALTPSGKPSKSKKNNGALVDGEKKPAKKRNSRSTSSNADSTRLRSISSSGDSTNEMLMYVQQHQQQQQMMGQEPLSPMHQPLPQQQQQQPQPFQQLISQQMHFMHQQSPTQQHQQPPPPPQMMPQQLQPQPPVYMYSPTPPPQIVVPRTPPPPVSPVAMGLNNRPNFYTEIKSPINSPPLNLSAGGGPPPLVIPSAKQIPQAPPSPQPTAQPMMSAIPPPLEDKPRHLEIIHQQQQLHQQHIIEDVLKIKIKSPAASPVKRELAPSPTNSSSMTCMLSPPPPPPIPIAQRLLCAETLKNELFHSHYSPASPSGSSPSIPKSSPVKLEYPPLSPVAPAEVKLEPSRIPTPPPPSSPVAVKLEHEIKEEASAIPIDPLPLVKKEEDLKQQPPELPIKEQPERSVTPDHLTSCEEIKEEPNLCDSLPGSPIKSCTSLAPGQVSSSNSTNSSPIASHHHHGGSGSSGKKKSVSSKDGSATTTTSTPTVKEEKKPSRKLTREERKMEAIVKAFEKMEQSQQRKQELKVQRKEGKRRSVSSSTPDEGTPCSSAKKRSLSSSQQKRKKKKSKSLSQHFGSPNQSRKKKVSKSSSSKKASRSLCSDRPYESKAAELLLTFSQSQSAEQSQSSYFGDDVKPIAGEGSELLNNNNNNAASVSNLPLLSSACMLVEAAVGPLEQVAPSMGSSEQDFKFPQKAKTKKSMSREWLSGQVVDSSTTVPFRRITPDQDSGYMSEDKSHDYRPSVTTPLGVDVSDPNICKKVEEFIAQNSPQPDEIGSNSATTTLTASPAVSTPVEPSQTQQQSNVSESAAVKKRWLRQAISEETDELTQASSSPPPPNGFTTPLKKRRVICQTEQTTPQVNQPLQQQPILSAQKIDFANHPPQQQHHHQQQQPLTMSSVVTNYSDRSMYWSNAVPSPYTEEKHAMDLSRTAPPPVVTPLVVQQQQPRIAPYKIVPIAQALTPLHFTDPDPLPLPPVVVAPPAPPVPVMVQQHYHQQESHDFAHRQPPPSVTMSPYEPLPPPASAVAAMVPASLLPPVVDPVMPQIPQQQQHVRIDVSYPTSADQQQPPLQRAIPRSKGSQKYIGSPAKFEPPASPASSVAETPEKNSLPASGGSSGVNSDEEVEQQQPVQKEEVIPEEPVVVVAQVEEMSVDQEEPEPEPVEESVVQESVVVQEVEPEPELKEDNEVVHEEVIVTGEVVVEQMEVSSTEETVAEVTVEESAPVPCVEEPVVLKPAEVVNGREKTSRKVAPPEEECEKNELEDLQKVIASFHSENIMNLISRNKKAKKGSRDGSGSKRQAKVKQIPVVKDEFNILPLAAAVSLEQSEIVEPVVPEPVKEPVEIVVSDPEPEPEPVPQPVPPPVVPVEEPAVSILGRSYSHPSWATATEAYREPPTEIRTSLSTLRPDIPPINFNSPSTYQSNAARNLLSSLSVGSEPLSSLTSFRPSSTFLDYPKPTPPPSSTTPSITPGATNVNAASSMYQYRPSTEISTLLEKGFSSTRPSSFTTLGTERVPSVTGSATPNSTITPERTVTSSFLSLSSPKVTENLSTLGSSATAYPKIFTKTAISDPRLNPALTTPEPAAPITPKRKLSINEYRQRKMQSCSSSTTTTPSIGSGCALAAAAVTTTSSESSSVTSSSSNSPGSGNVSSSLGSNDVSSSISKELSLELELELGGREEVADSVGTTTEPTSSTEEAVQT